LEPAAGRRTGLTQGFFAELLERRSPRQIHPAKSKLRTYLRVCADSFVMNLQKAASRQSAVATHRTIALDFQAAEANWGATIDPALDSFS